MKKTNNLLDWDLEKYDTRSKSLDVLIDIFQGGIIPEKFQKNERDYLEKLFFQNTKWRLTVLACNMLMKYYNYQEILIPLAKDQKTLTFSAKILLHIDACINSPWCAKSKSIIVFNDDVAMELKLFDGNLKEFVEFKSDSLEE